MTEKLSPEVRQAVRDTVYAFQHEQLGGDPDTFVRAVEKRLEPKHPPKGAICEAMIGRERCLRYANGKGKFATSMWPGDEHEFVDEDLDRFLHYRVIPTAKDALDLLQRLTRFGGSEGVVMAANLYKDAIKDLIDHAMEE